MADDIALNRFVDIGDGLCPCLYAIEEVSSMVVALDEAYIVGAERSFQDVRRACIDAASMDVDPAVGSLECGSVACYISVSFLPFFSGGPAGEVHRNAAAVLQNNIPVQRIVADAPT